MNSLVLLNAIPGWATADSVAPSPFTYALWIIIVPLVVMAVVWALAVGARSRQNVSHINQAAGLDDGGERAVMLSRLKTPRHAEVEAEPLAGGAHRA